MRCTHPVILWSFSLFHFFSSFYDNCSFHLHYCWFHPVLTGFGARGLSAADCRALFLGTSSMGGWRLSSGAAKDDMFLWLLDICYGCIFVAIRVYANAVDRCHPAIPALKQMAPHLFFISFNVFWSVSISFDIDLFQSLFLFECLCILPALHLTVLLFGVQHLAPGRVAIPRWLGLCPRTVLMLEPGKPVVVTMVQRMLPGMRQVELQMQQQAPNFGAFWDGNTAFSKSKTTYCEFHFVGNCIQTA